MNRPKRTKIDEVASRLGVSPATVSRAFNSPQIVRKSVREEILRVAEEMGYTAHGAARILATQKSRAIGAIVPSLRSAMFAHFIEGLQRRLQEDNYTLLLATSEYNAEKEYLSARAMIERSIDGIMVVGESHDPRFYTLIKGSGVPFVQTLAQPGANQHPCIGYDFNTVAGLVVDHLVRLGHRRFGILQGDQRRNDRVKHYEAAIRARLQFHGIDLPEDHVMDSEYTVQAARRTFLDMARRGPLPTAVICGNDTLAFGVVAEALAQGLAVPHYLSVVGLGNLEFAAHFARPLTTVQTPKDEIGVLAGDYLLAQAEGRPFVLDGNVPVKLILRDTTAVPRSS